MVAVIKTGHSIHRIFNYNENKVKEGIAECIGAGNYPVDIEKMTGTIKLNRLLKQAALNENVSRKSVHISLNFDATDTGLSKEKLIQIADTYMQKIGFGKQPYLVYQHFDAGHPHIHIVSIKIQDDGSRIDTQNIGRNQSEKARKEIEQSFGLVAADERKRRQAFQINPVDVRKVQYGRTETKRAITNVLDAVLNKYNYTSLPELNAVLKQYNVMADRGSEHSRIFQGGGLVYRILDEDGRPVGVPIKASDFYNKPTLKFLEQQYKLNEPKRQPLKVRVRNEIDRLFIRKRPSLDEVINELQKKGIYVTLRRNDGGLIYGITYIDHQSKAVFNGSDLGKQYSAKVMQERCWPKEVLRQDLLSQPAAKQDIGLQPQATAAAETKISENAFEPGFNSKGTDTILDALIQPEKTTDYVPGQLKKKGRKKKRRKNISGNQ